LFKDNSAILSHSNDITTRAIWKQNAYYLNNIYINWPLLEPIIYKVDTIINSNTLDLYHKRFSHINKDYLTKTINCTKGLNKDVSKELDNCDSCYFGKFHEIVSRKPLLSPETILTFFDVDIAGPFKIKGLKGERYFATFTDRKSRAV